MNFLLISLLLQMQISLPDRATVVNPVSTYSIPKQFQKDYDKIWNRFLAGKDDVKVSAELDKLQKKAGELLPALLLRSYLDLYAGRQSDAERRFRSVLEKSSTDPVALYYLGEIAYSRSDFIDASTYYGRLNRTGARTPSLEQKSQRALLLAMDKLLQEAKQAIADNRLTDAEKLYRRALDLAPSEPALHQQLADVLAHEGKREEAEAVAVRESGARDRESFVAAAVNPENAADVGRWGSAIGHFHEIQETESLTREQLAALLMNYFPILGSFGSTPEVLADVEQSWAESAIQTVVRIGLLDSMANHTFQPARTVTRGEFAACLARLTRLLGVPAGTRAAIRPLDVVPDSTLYRELQPVLGYELMTLDNAGNFNVGASLRGAEAVITAEKLLRLLQKNTG
jgi:tetratricopeptide (TPR) repeat protein